MLTIIFPKIRTGLILWLLIGVLGVWPAQSALAQEGTVYTVQRDDSLWKIAEKYLGSGRRFSEIIQATNARQASDRSFFRIDDPSVIHAGGKLLIPSGAQLPTPADSVVQPDPKVEGAAAQPEPVPRVAPVTTGPSGHIAFSFWNNAPNRCTYEIDIIDVEACLTSPEACQAKRRIFPLNNVSEPALPPDGQQLAFRGWGAIPEKIKERDHPYQNCAAPATERSIQTTTLDATQLRHITAYWEDSHPDWSPDGSRILFDTQRLGDGQTYIMFNYADTPGERADGPQAEDVRISGQQPSWAPDNERFVYRGCDLTGNRCGLWLAKAIPVKPWEAGLNMLGPILEEAAAAHPDWSPVSDDIVYQSPGSGSWDLYVVNADGTNKRRLTTGAAVEGLPAWSPDGQWIAYLSNVTGHWGIWIVGADGSNARQLFAFDGGQFTPKVVPPYDGRDWLDEQISWSR